MGVRWGALFAAALGSTMVVGEESVCEPEQYAVLDEQRNVTVCHECAACGSGQRCIRQAAEDGSVPAGCADCQAGRYNDDHDPITGCVGALELPTPLRNFP